MNCVPTTCQPQCLFCRLTAQGHHCGFRLYDIKVEGPWWVGWEAASHPGWLLKSSFPGGKLKSKEKAEKGSEKRKTSLLPNPVRSPWRAGHLFANPQHPAGEGTQDLESGRPGYPHGPALPIIMTRPVTDRSAVEVCTGTWGLDTPCLIITAIDPMIKQDTQQRAATWLILAAPDLWPPCPLTLVL